jgi:hypothetical protein
MTFKPAARSPADPPDVYTLMLSVFSGLTALALGAAPESLESAMPKWAVLTWSVVLCLGSVIALFGVARQTVTGIIAEQVGSVMVGVTAIFYPVVAIYTLGWGTVQVVGVIFAWGVACLWRWGQLQALLNNAVQRQVKEEMIRKIHADIEARLARERHQED